MNRLAPQSIYSDFTNNFDVHPDTGDLFRITDINAVKRSVRNIVLTDKYERPFVPDFGCNVRALLFENMTPDVLNAAKDTITSAISKWEPRVANVQTMVQQYPQQNSIAITISFTIVNIAGTQSLTIPLQRVR